MNCIVNVDMNWGIGKNDQLLFTISADLKRFRALTTGKTVILGRRTLSTFPNGKPLKNRRNIILSRDSGLQIEGAEVYPDIPSMLRAVKMLPDDELCVIGGASVYEALLPYCTRAQVTKTLADGCADRFFPDLDKLPNWQIEAESEILEENGVRFQYVDYRNNEPLPR